MVIWVNIFLQEVKTKVWVEENFNCLVPNQMESGCWLLKSDVKQGCRARVPHQQKDPHVKVRFESVVRADNESVNKRFFLPNYRFLLIWIWIITVIARLCIVWYSTTFPLLLCNDRKYLLVASCSVEGSELAILKGFHLFLPILLIQFFNTRNSLPLRV